MIIPVLQSRLRISHVERMGFDPDWLLADSCSLWPDTLVNATEGSSLPQAVTHFNQGSEQNKTDSGENGGQNVDGGARCGGQWIR